MKIQEISRLTLWVRVLVQGESAGGYMAMQSALTQPAGTIKAVLVIYPMLDMRSK
jgi:acetyl esterase/lipase